MKGQVNCVKLSFTAVSLTLIMALLLGVSGSSLAVPETGDWGPWEWYYRNDTLDNFDQLGESPMLTDKVEAGELPPVEDRLPQDVLVLEGLEGIGQYGGMWRTGYVSAAQWTQPVSGIFGPPALARSAPDGQIIPNLAKSWELSEDAMEYTLYLREGVKWSDGEPFTADDFIFWYEAEFGNEYIMPSPPARWAPGGEPMQMEKIDDYTVHFTFAAPHPIFPNFIKRHGHYINQPKHFMSQFHPDFADSDELDALLDEYGLDQWWQLYDLKSEQIYWRSTNQQPDQPVLQPYVVVERTDDLVFFERNPYYYKVDAEGNQLPYIDELRAEAVSDSELKELKAIAGDWDYHDGQASSLPMYIENEEAGDFKTYVWQDSQMAVDSPHPNMTHQDPVLREIFQDARFRQALSLAIDRDEINELVYFNQAEPRQGTVIPPSPLFKQEYKEAYADYDVDRANAKLDDMGLERGPDGIRLRPDGEPLRFVLDCRATFIDRMATSELLVDYWQELGLDVRLEGIGAEYQYEMIAANEHDVTMWGSRMVGEQMERMIHPFIPSGGGGNPRTGPLWGQWYESGGTEGEEPPEWFGYLYDLWDVVQTTTDDEERYDALAQIVEAQAENIWFIGTVGLSPVPMVFNADLRNIPEELLFTFERDYAVLGNADTFYFDR